MRSDTLDCDATPLAPVASFQDAAALDEECAKLRERLATVTAERDLIDRALAGATKSVEAALFHLAKVTDERDAARTALEARPVGPAKPAPDEAGWWLLIAPGRTPIVYHIRPYQDGSDFFSGAWHRFRVQP